MTFCQVTYRYQNRLTEQHLSAMDALKGQIYGLRRFEVDERENLIRVDYDASRVEVREIEAALRRVGVAALERVEEAAQPQK